MPHPAATQPRLIHLADSSFLPQPAIVAALVALLTRQGYTAQGLPELGWKQQAEVLKQRVAASDAPEIIVIPGSAGLTARWEAVLDSQGMGVVGMTPRVVQDTWAAMHPLHDARSVAYLLNADHVPNPLKDIPNLVATGPWSMAVQADPRQMASVLWNHWNAFVQAQEQAQRLDETLASMAPVPPPRIRM